MHRAADGFHPQRQVQGHILSYPMEPTIVLQVLPRCEKIDRLNQSRFSVSEAHNTRQRDKTAVLYHSTEKVVHALH